MGNINFESRRFFDKINFFFLQEEQKAKEKTAKIKLALEKLKEAKVKKVSVITKLSANVYLVGNLEEVKLNRTLPSCKILNINCQMSITGWTLKPTVKLHCCLASCT